MKPALAIVALALFLSCQGRQWSADYLEVTGGRVDGSGDFEGWGLGYDADVFMVTAGWNLNPQRVELVNAPLGTYAVPPPCELPAQVPAPPDRIEGLEARIDQLVGALEKVNADLRKVRDHVHTIATRPTDEGQDWTQIALMILLGGGAVEGGRRVYGRAKGS